MNKNLRRGLIVRFLIGCLSMLLALWCLTQGTGWIPYATWPLAALGGGCLSTSLQGLYRLSRD